MLEGEALDYGLTFMRKTTYFNRNKGKSPKESSKKAKSKESSSKSTLVPLSSLAFNISPDEIASLFT